MQWTKYLRFPTYAMLLAALFAMPPKERFVEVALDPNAAELRRQRREAEARIQSGAVGFLQTKLSGSEVLRLSREEIGRRGKVPNQPEPSVYLDISRGYAQWYVTFEFGDILHREIATVIVDDASGKTRYSGNP